ncbi:MAG: LysM peptidoglycan-binding domain-containing protein [Clostridiales bacterium]|jgi:LysM repeat protein|nr:LysM peptidoglycan-binding domain-containing protein [Clostridiales bacterium]
MPDDTYHITDAEDDAITIAAAGTAAGSALVDAPAGDIAGSDVGEGDTGEKIDKIYKDLREFAEARKYQWVSAEPVDPEALAVRGGMLAQQIIPHAGWDDESERDSGPMQSAKTTRYSFATTKDIAAGTISASDTVTYDEIYGHTSVEHAKYAAHPAAERNTQLDDSDYSDETDSLSKRSPKNAADIDDDYDDYELSNGSIALKILLSVVLIVSIVIISMLVFKMSEINTQLKEVTNQLENAPQQEDLDAALALGVAKDAEIDRLNGELARHEADIASEGEVVETPDGYVYTVAKGDNLGLIARNFATSVTNLMDWNNIENANEIKVGQKLIVKLHTTADNNEE